MKRIVVLLILCVGLSQFAQGQTWNEWFRQKKTQKKYLLEQIAALKVFIDYARKGYEISSDGLGLIRKIKGGDFDLHDNYFSSLKLVNPRIKGYGKVAATIAIQIKIGKEFSKALAAMRASGQFTSAEVEYSEKVFERLLTDCLNCINELYVVITAGELEMKDDERIQHIDRLYADMQNKFSFCASYNEELGVLAMQRQAESVEVNYSKILNHIP